MAKPRKCERLEGNNTGKDQGDIFIISADATHVCTDTILRFAVACLHPFASFQPERCYCSEPPVPDRYRQLLATAQKCLSRRIQSFVKQTKRERGAARSRPDLLRRSISQRTRSRLSLFTLILEDLKTKQYKELEHFLRVKLEGQDEGLDESRLLVFSIFTERARRSGGDAQKLSSSSPVTLKCLHTRCRQMETK